MTDWLDRLRGTLEPILAKDDPRPDISAYREMPLCIFVIRPRPSSRCGRSSRC